MNPYRITPILSCPRNLFTNLCRRCTVPCIYEKSARQNYYYYYYFFINNFLVGSARHYRAVMIFAKKCNFNRLLLLILFLLVCIIYIMNSLRDGCPADKLKRARRRRRRFTMRVKRKLIGRESACGREAQYNNIYAS